MSDDLPSPSTGPYGPRPAISPSAFGRPFGSSGFSAPPPSGDVVASASLMGAPVQTAPWRTRAICALIDSLLALTPALLVGLIGLYTIYYPSCDEYKFLGGTRRSCANAGTAGTAVWVLVLVAFVGFVFLVEIRPIGRNGQTKSMRWFGVRVVDRAGSVVIGTKRAALRTLLRFTVSTSFGGMGYWWALVDHRQLTWHDLIVESAAVPVEPVHERPTIPGLRSIPQLSLPGRRPRPSGDIEFEEL